MVHLLFYYGGIMNLSCVVTVLNGNIKFWYSRSKAIERFSAMHFSLGSSTILDQLIHGGHVCFDRDYSPDVIARANLLFEYGIYLENLC